MTDHTPTTEHKVTIDDLIDGWACEHMRADDRLEDVRDAAKKALAAHDRKIAAKALREARDDIAAMANDDLTVIVGDPDDDETWVPVRLEDWLDIRADRIEQGDDQ